MAKSESPTITSRAFTAGPLSEAGFTSLVTRDGQRQRALDVLLLVKRRLSALDVGLTPAVGIGLEERFHGDAGDRLLGRLHRAGEREETTST